MCKIFSFGNHNLSNVYIIILLHSWLSRELDTIYNDRKILSNAIYAIEKTVLIALNATAFVTKMLTVLVVLKT